MKDHKEKAFAQIRLNGFHLTFPNGNWISTIWGAGSYSDNHFTWLREGLSTFNMPLESSTCEIMIACKPRLLKQIHKKYEGDGSVIGNLSIAQWLEILNILANDRNNITQESD